MVATRDPLDQRGQVRELFSLMKLVGIVADARGPLCAQEKFF
jgi:hypothetical protein